MKKRFFFIVCSLLAWFITTSQNVGINATGGSPNASAGLDVDFTNKGLLIPRIELTSTGDNTTISNPATSLLVFNTASTGDVTPGYYYWGGSAWVRLSTGSSGGGNSWELTGNSGTIDGTHYVGTNDYIALNFRVNNQKAGRIGKLADGSTFLGYQSGNSDDLTNNRNTFIGYQAGVSTTMGNSNTAVGYGACFNNIASNSATAIGYYAMYNANNTATSQHNYNVAIGAYSLYGSSTPANNTGHQNTAVGAYAMYNNTSGSYNTALGRMALNGNTSGEHNSGIGYQVLVYNNTGTSNTAQGSQAINSNTSGNANTAIGREAMYLNETGSFNTSHGYQALYYNSTGNYNTAVGFSTGVKTGYGNLENTIAIGGQGNLEINSSNMVRIGNVSTNSIGGQVVWTAISDERVKDQVREDVSGLHFIMKLRPVTYQSNVDKENNLQGFASKDNPSSKYDIEKIRFSGFLAQEVEAAAQSAGYDFSGVDKSAVENGLWGLRYAEFTVPLVKAVQELNEANKVQQKLIDKLIEQNESLKKRIEKLEK
jgi:hypothetical protein